MNEIEKRIAAIPEVEPDEWDLEMLAEIDAEYDPEDEGVTLEEMDRIREEKEFTGKVSLRLPKELQANLYYEAKRQGVSLNQYCLYKLAQR